MFNLERFIKQRDDIVKTLQTCSIPIILFNKDSIPKQLPCAIVILDSEDGTKGTCRQFTSTDIVWTVFLIVNAQNTNDPDFNLYKLKEQFRNNLIKLANRDIPLYRVLHLQDRRHLSGQDSQDRPA